MTERGEELADTAMQAGENDVCFQCVWTHDFPYEQLSMDLKVFLLKSDKNNINQS